MGGEKYNTCALHAHPPCPSWEEEVVGGGNEKHPVQQQPSPAIIQEEINWMLVWNLGEMIMVTIQEDMHRAKTIHL